MSRVMMSYKNYSILVSTYGSVSNTDPAVFPEELFRPIPVLFLEIIYRNSLLDEH